MWLSHQTTYQPIVPGLIKQMGENAPASKDDSEDAGDNELATEPRYAKRCHLQRGFFPQNKFRVKDCFEERRPGEGGVTCILYSSGSFVIILYLSGSFVRILLCLSHVYCQACVAVPVRYLCPYLTVPLSPV